MSGAWFLWNIFFSSLIFIINFDTEKANTFTFLIILIVKSLLIQLHCTNLLLWLPICRKKRAITRHLFVSHSSEISQAFIIHSSGISQTFISYPSGIHQALGCFKSAKNFICQKLQHFLADSEYFGKINTKKKFQFFFNVYLCLRDHSSITSSCFWLF